MELCNDTHRQEDSRAWFYLALELHISAVLPAVVAERSWAIPGFHNVPDCVRVMHLNASVVDHHNFAQLFVAMSASDENLRTFSERAPSDGAAKLALAEVSDESEVRRTFELSVHTHEVQSI